MAYFTLDISKLDASISSYKNKRKEVNSDLKVIYDSLKNTDSGWSDEDSEAFVMTIKEDQYKVDTYLTELDSLYEQIEEFKKAFENLLAHYGFKSNSMIKYDDSYYQKCVKNLTNTFNYLNNALYYLNNCNFKSDFPEIYRAYTLRNEIKRLKNVVNDMLNTTNGFKSAVDRILADTRMAMGKVGNISFNVKLFSYKWKLVDLEVKKADEVKIDQENAADREIEINRASIDSGVIDSINAGTVYGAAKTLDNATISADFNGEKGINNLDIRGEGVVAGERELDASLPNANAVSFSGLDIRGQGVSSEEKELDIEDTAQNVANTNGMDINDQEAKEEELGVEIQSETLKNNLGIPEQEVSVDSKGFVSESVDNNATVINEGPTNGESITVDKLEATSNSGMNIEASSVGDGINVGSVEVGSNTFNMNTTAPKMESITTDIYEGISNPGINIESSNMSGINVGTVEVGNNTFNMNSTSPAMEGIRVNTYEGINNSELNIASRQMGNLDNIKAVDAKDIGINS